MGFDALKEKALSLPLSPGVYIMKDKSDTVIYVGKAKKLKNRVSQYFQDTASHTPKTRLMVSKIDHFDVIVAASEFEALILECSLIKRYHPKYNILLKDDKGYPFLRLNMKETYPRVTMVNSVSDDGAEYFGPFGSRGVTQSLLKALRLALKLPDCGKSFPRDIGKDRPCLNYHLNQCAGWCLPENSAQQYGQIMQQARQLLLGNYKAVAAQIRTEMLTAAEEMNFELAASLRDRLRAVEILGKKQLVTAATSADTDVIGYAQTETKACFAVLHFSDGNLLDKEYVLLPVPDQKETAISALLKQFYLSRGFAPKVILLPCAVEDSMLFEQLLQQKFGRKTYIRIPQRGDNAALIALAVANAQEEAERVTDREERLHSALSVLGKMLGIPAPKRVESFDISNIAGTDIVASMVVFLDGKPAPSQYKRFKINDLVQQDDYASMEQVISRRFLRYLSQDAGFDTLPDLLLIDGGVIHATTALKVLNSLDITLPVFGMVKDDRHRTRALVTPQGQEIGIDGNQTVFSLIGNIQEETHRFAITYHKKLRSKRLRYSELDKIPGIGPKRKQLLLKKFQSLQGIGAASLDELERFLPKDAALAVYRYFRNKLEENNESDFGDSPGSESKNP